MSLEAFRRRLPDSNFGKNDLFWFPRWLMRYAAGKSLKNGVLPVTTELVVEFSKSLLNSGTPAWQRLQGVRAVEAYRDLVLNTAEPPLKQVKQVLARLAAQEKDSGTASGSPGISDEQQLVGFIDPSEPDVVQTMRKELRLHRLSLETERAYIGWIVRFDQGHIIVRNGKGDKDRFTVLPDKCRQDLIEQVERVRRLHQRDLDAGFGKVWLPHALERRYPNDSRVFGWQWIFPSQRMKSPVDAM